MLQANRIVLDSLKVIPKNAKIDSQSSIESRVQFEEGVEIINSKVRGPCVLGKGVKVINSYIGPYTSLSAGVVIQDCQIEHSIVLNDSKILGLKYRVQDSLIGKGVLLEQKNSSPNSYQIMVGDNSEVFVL